MTPRRPNEPDGQEPEEFELFPSLREPQYSQSLERGLAILGCFTPQRSVLGIAEIADELGMSRSTTHRYVITLVVLGYMEQGASRKYRLGLRVADLGMAVLNSIGLREPSRAPLEELRSRTGFTASLAILDGVEILYVERARSYQRGQQIDLNLRLGSRLPAYCTAMGKVLLASLTEAEQRTLIAGLTLTPHGPNTITTKKALVTELAHVLDEGIAVNDEELVPGVVEVACPVREAQAEVLAAIGLAAYTSTIASEEMVDQFLPHLLATADDISARLGYRLGNPNRPSR